MKKAKSCQVCKSDFTIEAEDLDFYKNIEVPPPTFCQTCRYINRMIWRNERSLYKGSCGLCDKSIITIYSPDKNITTYCNECFYSDKWNPLDQGQEYDFSKPFFEQFNELQAKIPRLYAFVTKNFNTEYANGAQQNKNCYLIFVSDHNEDSLYSQGLFKCKNTADCYGVNESEKCYESINCVKCYKVNYSIDCSDSSNLYFCKNCVNCQDCIGSTNLRNKKYYIFNQPHTKEEYEAKLKELNLSSRKSIQELQKKAEEKWKEAASKYIHGTHNIETTGDYVHNSKNSKWVFNCENDEDAKRLNYGYSTKNSQDCYVIVDNSQFCYQVVSGISLNNVKLSYCVWTNNDLEYCDTAINCNNLFGCVGVQKKQYCILNKQYSKEEYEELLPKIKKHMDEMPYTDKEGRVYKYGDFFPSEFSPFSYNETVAQEYFPISEDTAKQKGYLWKEKEASSHKATLNKDSLPDTIAEVGDGILKEVIECSHRGECEHGCSGAFKVTPQELTLYKQENIPIPEFCHNCRHHRRLEYRNPLNLWHSKCQCAGNKSSNSIYENVAEHDHGGNSCPNEFETAYSPEKEDIIYCETCYQAEIA